MKNKIKILFSLFLITSCIPARRYYTYEYKTFAKNLDLSRGKWILTPITSTSFGRNQDNSYSILKDFLTAKLGDRLKISNKLKNKNNKYLIPFALNFDNVKENIGSLKELSNCDYIISSKIYYLEDTPNLAKEQYHTTKRIKSEYKSACKIAIIAYDLETLEEFFNIECFGYVWVDDEDEDERIRLYQNSKSSSNKVMNKLIKKLKK